MRYFSLLTTICTRVSSEAVNRINTMITNAYKNRNPKLSGGGGLGGPGMLHAKVPSLAEVNLSQPPPLMSINAQPPPPNALQGPPPVRTAAGTQL